MILSGRTSAPTHHQMDVIHTHMHRQRLPSLLSTAIQQRVQYDFPIGWIEPVGWLVHASQLCP
jgi:hypothetical protein